MSVDFKLCNKCGKCQNCKAVEHVTETALISCMEMGELMSSFDAMLKSQATNGRQKEFLKKFIETLSMMEDCIENMEFKS